MLGERATHKSDLRHLPSERKENVDRTGEPMFVKRKFVGLCSAAAVMVGSVGLLSPGLAVANPSSCSTSRIDHDTFIGKCSKGTGAFRLRVDCSKLEKDAVGPWLAAGKTDSQGCRWGAARRASIETRN